MKRQKASPAKCTLLKNRRLVIILFVIVIIVVVEQRFLFCFSSLAPSYRIRGIFSFDASLRDLLGPTRLTRPVKCFLSRILISFSRRPRPFCRLRLLTQCR